MTTPKDRALQYAVSESTMTDMAYKVNKPSPRPDLEPEFNDSLNIMSCLGDMMSALNDRGIAELDDETIAKAGSTIYWESIKLRKLFYELLKDNSTNSKPVTK